MSLILRIALLAFVLPVHAETLSLTEALHESLQTSPEVLKARSQANEASWGKTEATSYFLPTLTGDARYLTDKKYMLINMDFGNNPVVIPSIVPTADYTLTAQWSVFDGFASTNRWKAASRREGAAEKLREWTEFSTRRTVALLFYKGLAAENLKQVAYQNLTTLKDHQKDVMALKRAGISTKYDVLRTETQLSEAESEILSADDNVEMAKYKLGEALGKDREERPLEGKLPILTPEIIKDLKPESVDQRRDLQALADRTEALEYLDRAEGRHWVPRVSVFGQYQYYNNLDDSVWDRDMLREAYQVGIQLTWNLFDGFHSVARSQQSAEQAFQSQKGLQQARLKAHQDFEFWRRKFLYYCAVYRARDADINRSSEAVRLASIGRKAGARTTTDLLDAELDLFRARAGLVNAQIGATEALIQLELASGEKLYDFN